VSSSGSYVTWRRAPPAAKMRAEGGTPAAGRTGRATPRSPRDACAVGQSLHASTAEEDRYRECRNPPI
jgi:hypothetical protein